MIRDSIGYSDAASSDVMRVMCGGGDLLTIDVGFWSAASIIASRVIATVPVSLRPRLRRVSVSVSMSSASVSVSPVCLCLCSCLC